MCTGGLRRRVLATLWHAAHVQTTWSGGCSMRGWCTPGHAVARLRSHPDHRSEGTACHTAGG